MDATALTLTQIAALPPDEAWHAIDVLAEAAFDALPQMERQSHDISDWCGGYRAALTLAVASLRDVRAQVAAESRAAADAGPMRADEVQTGFALRLVRADFYSDAANIAEHGPAKS